MTPFETDIFNMLPSPAAGQSLDAWALNGAVQDGNGNFPTYTGAATVFANDGNDGSGTPLCLNGTHPASTGGDILPLQDANGNPVVYPQTNNISFGIWIGPSVTNQFGRFWANGAVGARGWSILQSDGTNTSNPGNQISLEFMGVHQNVCGSFAITPGLIPYYVVVEISSSNVATLKYRTGQTSSVVTVGSSSVHTMIAPISGTDNLFVLGDGANGVNGVVAEAWVMVGNLPTDTQLNTQFADGKIIPAVSSNVPANSATGISTGTTVAATFSKMMIPSTLAFTLTDSSGNAVATTRIYNPFTFTATWIPTLGLKGSTTYTATITAGTAIDGNILSGSTSWTFTTTPSVTPTVSSKTPASGNGYVSISSPITATFNENIASATFALTTTTGGANVPVTATYNAQTFTFVWTPNAPLSATTQYTATISAATDPAGNHLASAVSWNFTTTTAPDTSKPTLAWRYSHKSGWKCQPSRSPTVAVSNTLGLWIFANFSSNASADLSANAHPCTFPNGVMDVPNSGGVGNTYFPASFVPQLNGTNQYGSIATLLNTTVPTQWTISAQFVVNSAPATGARIFQKIMGSGDEFDWYFTGGNPGTLQINTIGNGTTYSFTTASVDLLDSNAHTISQSFDGTNLRTFLDGVSLNIAPGASPRSGGTGNTFLGASATPGNYSPITLQLFEVIPRALTPAEIEQRHQQWAGPQNTSYTRLKYQQNISLPQYGGQLQEPTILYDAIGKYQKGRYDIITTAGYGNECTVCLTSIDGKNWTDAGVAIGSGFGGESLTHQPFVFQDVDGTRYLYYSGTTGSGDGVLNVATTTDGQHFTRAGIAAAPAGLASGALTDGAVVNFNGTYFMLIACGVSGYVGFFETFLFTASNPLGPFTIQNGGNPFSSLDPMQGGISGGGCIFPRPVNGLWHTWFHGPTTANESAVTQIFHFFNTSLTTDAWQPFTDSPEFPLDIPGYQQRANPTIVFDGENIFFVMCRVNNSSPQTASLDIYVAQSTTPEELFSPDNIPGAVSVKGSLALSRSR
jgi:hypothetical protein